MNRRRTQTGDPEPLFETSVALADASLARTLAGPAHANLALVEAAFGARLTAAGGDIRVSAPDALSLERTREALGAMADRAADRGELSSGDVRAAIAFARAGSGARLDRAGASIVLPGRRTIAPRTPRQSAYLKALASGEADLVFGVGPAGTGKTYLAVAAGVAMLLDGRVSRVVVTRPAVEAGERLGFLPGALEEKVDPYLQPIWDAFKALLGPGPFEARKAKGEIEVAPLAFMRGRTLSDAMVIVDEAQNATRMQMKMLLTRLGEGSRMAVNGDPSQVDLPRASDSGLAHALGLLDGVEGVAVVRFGVEDVVRHPLVGRIVAAYDADARRAGELRERPVAKAPANREQASPAPAGDDAVMGPEVSVEDPRWTAALGDMDTLAISVWTELARDFELEGDAVSVLFTNDAAVRDLNARFRAQDKPTNVLSFPSVDTAGECFLGDVALAFETCAREAGEQGKTLDQHVRHLLVHGVLHLLGYDHESDAEAAEMEALERDILARMGVPDPYGDNG